MSYYETTLAMLTILKVGGFTTGGLNFDAHIRRNSVESADLAALAKDYGTLAIQSGKQERLEDLVKQFLMGLRRAPLQAQGLSKRTPMLWESATFRVTSVRP
jgi:xylose isomerase